MIRKALMLASTLLVGAAPAGPSLADRILPPPVKPGAAVVPFVKMDAARIVIAHVRVIDGTGAAPLEDRTVVVEGGKIAAVLGPGEAPPAPAAGTAMIDGTGKTLLPGLVGMHDHLYYIERPNLDASGRSQPPLIVPQMPFSSPRLYLAGGVTTIRTTGSVEPYVDVNLKRDIDAGKLPGPHMDVTAPYLEGQGSPFVQMHGLTGPEDARRTVAFWADQGATSFKAYMNITRAELGAAIAEAHRRGLKLTGHLCSVTYPEAVALGIDNLEHGFFVNTQLDPGKKPDLCPATSGTPTLLAMDPEGADAKALIQLLVSKHVAVTSTLPVFAHQALGYRPLGPRELSVLMPQTQLDYFYLRNVLGRLPEAVRQQQARTWDNDLKLERAFVAAGGLLLAGPDPTGAGDVIPGFGDQREVELLVAAGFTPMEAIRIATLNGATYLRLADRIGSIAPGKNADLILVNGDPSKRIEDIENVETVFKDGVGYDPAALLASVKGRYGQY